MSEYRPPLQPADGPPASPPKQEPSEYSVEFLVETPEGFHVLMRGEHLTPRDFPVWTRQASKALHDQGFKPVRRDLVVELPANAPSAGSSGGAVAEWIKGENGMPPRCSIHGAGEFKEGTYRQDHAKAGQSYAFWACKTRSCRPKGSPV